jgi:hypothetical protein
MTFDQPNEVNRGPPIYFLPRWAAKTIEVVGVDAADASCGSQTRSQKQHAIVALMTCVLETSDPITYSYIEGWLEWEHTMKTGIDSLSKNHTWELVPRPQGKNIVKCRWVYRTKFTSEGVVE